MLHLIQLITAFYYRLEHVIRIKGTALGWFKSYLSDRFQFVLVNEESFLHARVSHGVPQGSLLGPIFFTLYMLPSGNLMRHSYTFVIFLSQSDAEKLLYYCNSLLLGFPKHSLKSLQLIQNAADRVLMRTSRRDHISPV